MWEWLSFKWFSYQTLHSFVWDDGFYLYGIGLIPFIFLLRNVFHARDFQAISLTFVNTQITRSLSSLLRYFYPIFGFLAVTFTIIALARPQVVNTISETESEIIDLIIAMDISDSMLETDLHPNRLAAAKSVAQSFIRDRSKDRIGIVAFAGEAFTLCPLTTDYELIQQFLTELNQKMISVAGTAIGSALALSTNRLRESSAKSKVIILLSDGDNTAGNLDPVTAAKLAKVFNIKIYTILVGVNKSAAENVNLNIDEGILKNIATIGQGHFYRATNNATLQNIFSQIDKLERGKIKSQNYKEVKDYYRVYLNWAILMILAMLLLKATFVANVLED